MPDKHDADEIGAMTKMFALLLRGHSQSLAQSSLQLSPLAEQFRHILDAFAQLNARTERETVQTAHRDRTAIEHILAGYAAAWDAYRRAQTCLADNFNILSVLQLTQKEIRHSMILAWLLDHDLTRLGTHAQGSLGFRLFLQRFGLPLGYAALPYWVRREVAGNEAIVDIEVACRGKFLIHIENKIWSSEGADQTDREWGDLQRRAVELGINPQSEPPSVHALFLTPRGSRPMNPSFRAISWVGVVSVLEAFAEAAQPADVKLFAAHYARGLRRFVVTQDQGREAQDGERVSE